MHTLVKAAYRRGNFIDTAEAIGRLSLLDDAHAAVKAEIEYFLGNQNNAFTLASRLLRSVSAPEIRWRLLSVVASIKWDSGDLGESVEMTTEAYQLALATSEPAAIARTAATLLERTCNGAAYASALPLSVVARRATLRTGDAQLFAFLHLTHGRLEAKSGNLSLANRHFDRCQALLAEETNLWLSAAALLDQTHILTLQGDVPAAIDAAAAGARLADEAGWSKGIAAGAANLSSLFLALGDLDSAQEQLELAASQRFSSPAFQCALRDTQARLVAQRGDPEKAEVILAEVSSLGDVAPKWYTLKANESLARLYLARGKYGDALRVAEVCATASKAAGFRTLVNAFNSFRITARHALGEPITTADLAGDWNISETPATNTLVECERLAQLLSHEAPKRAKTFDARRQRIALRTADYIGVRTPEDGLAEESGDGATLDSAVALLELAGHPHILGAEAIALLKGANCAARMALVATGPSGSRVVDAVGWDAAGALAAAAAATGGIEHLPLGRRTDETWMLAVEPVRELEPYCTFAAIRKLLAIALSLDGYRRDERQRAALWPADALDGDSDCIWASEQISEVLTTARRIAPTPLPVLITGETGTGKEMIARAIHRASTRADRPFLPFNCAAVPREMLESQLFGYRKGAFTSADSGFPGVIRSATGGTLFLDEIGEIGPEMQPKLLRFLETHEIHPLGEPQPIKVDVRVIAATNASVERLIADGKFRDDLFYRLNVMRLSLPPLRERREEIPPLVQHYARKYADEQRKGALTVADETLEYLLLFSWPGNVRQLANEIRRMVALAEPDSALTPSLLSSEIQASRRTIATSTSPDIEARVPLDQPLPVAVEMLEQLMVRRALDRTHGRVEEASRLLGISRKGLFLKRRRWGLGQVS